MQDPFDAMLVTPASVLVRNASGVADDYGISDPEFKVVGTCNVFVSLGKGRARERKDGAKWSKNYREVFMRPFVDTEGHALSSLHWLLIGGIYYDVFQIDNPGGMNHHLEVWCELLNKG